MRTDGSVNPPIEYDLTKDEMPCRRTHIRNFVTGEYIFLDERGREERKRNTPVSHP